MPNLSWLSPRQSLIGKLVVFGIVPAVLVVAGGIAYGTWSTYQSARDQQEVALRSLARQVALEVETGNARAVLATDMMARAQASGLFGNRVASTEYARQVLAAHPEFAAAYIGYEPDADGKDSLFRESGGAGSQGQAQGADGRFLPYWSRGDYDDPGLLTLEPMTGMEESLFYQGVKTRFAIDHVPRAIVTEPHLYDGSMIVEQTFPIVIRGQFKGIAGINRSLDDILVLLRAIGQRQGTDIFLISGRGRIIATTTTDDWKLRTKGVADTVYSGLFMPLLGAHQESQFVRATDPLDGGDYFFVSASVPTGDWLVVVRSAEAKVSAPLWDLLTRMSLVGLVSLLLAGLFLGYSLRRFRQRIGMAAAASDRLAAGDIPADADLDTQSADEIGRLSRSLAQLVAAERTVAEVCAAIADGDFSQTVPPRGDGDRLAHSINTMTRRRHDAEEALRRQQRRFANLLEAAPDATVIVAPDGRLTFANAQAGRLFGHAVDGMVGQPVEMLLPEAVRERHVGLRDGFFADPKARAMGGKFDLAAQAADGHVFPVEVSLGPIETDEGLMVAASVRDVTERRAAENEIRERVEELGAARRATLNMMSDLDREKKTAEDLRRQAEQAYALVSSSIEYASRIQRSLLPQDAFMNEDLSDHFVVWEPRDVVGGDLYWYRRCRDGFLVALADCTGHGVPGAFMTLLATGALDRALRDRPDGDPAQLLALINRSIKYSLGQGQSQEGESDDGLEMGICLIRPDARALLFAGARFPLFKIDAGEVVEIKGSRGGLGYRRVADDQFYEVEEVKIGEGARFYLCSDGLFDQIGGEKRRAFGKRRFSEVLLGVRERPMVEQREELMRVFGDYQGDELRRDDVSVIGFSV